MYTSVQKVMEMEPEQVEFCCMVFAIGNDELVVGGNERDVNAENREQWRDAVLEFYLSRCASAH